MHLRVLILPQSKGMLEVTPTSASDIILHQLHKPLIFITFHFGNPDKHAAKSLHVRKKHIHTP